MRFMLACLTALLLAAPATAQRHGREPEWRTAVTADVLLEPFNYEPREFSLPAGQPVLLVFVNNGQAWLSFRAPRFFAAARVRRSDRHHLENGGFRLAPGDRLTIALVPARGRYDVYSGDLFHRLRGMVARINVE